MSTPPPSAPSDVAAIAAQVPPPRGAQTEGLLGESPIEETTEQKVDEIEMIGEEEAAGFRPPAYSEVSAGMRYLHCSRTIHQLVSDRNRSVGLYLGVATLLWTASTALLNARPSARLLIPIETIQLWCLPVTFGTMTVLALFVGFLLIRTRVGLIYEVAKMNVLLGLPVGRVKRVNPLSIFFLMHVLVSVAGGGSGTLFTLYVLADPDTGRAPLLAAVLVGIVITLLLIFIYVATVLHTTSDRKLQGGNKTVTS
jgi:hypothetical protein